MALIPKTPEKRDEIKWDNKFGYYYKIEDFHGFGKLKKKRNCLLPNSIKNILPLIVQRLSSQGTVMLYWKQEKWRGRGHVGGDMGSDRGRKVTSLEVSRVCSVTPCGNE